MERSFRFLKDPLFLASSLYLKNEKQHGIILDALGQNDRQLYASPPT